MNLPHNGMQTLADEAAKIANLCSQHRNTVGPLFMQLVAAFSGILAHYPVEDEPAMSADIARDLVEITFKNGREAEVYRIFRNEVGAIEAERVTIN